MVPKIYYSEIDGSELREAYQGIIKGRKISKGMQQSLKDIGRPSRISHESVLKAYKIWSSGKMTQLEIAEAWGVSERTVRRKFSALKEFNM